MIPITSPNELDEASNILLHSKILLPAAEVINLLATSFSSEVSLS